MLNLFFAFLFSTQVALADEAPKSFWEPINTEMVAGLIREDIRAFAEEAKTRPAGGDTLATGLREALEQRLAPLASEGGIWTYRVRVEPTGPRAMQARIWVRLSDHSPELAMTFDITIGTAGPAEDAPERQRSA